MVQLTTTYDQTINRKVFVLKGEEAYAKTTDTILNVIEFEGDRTLTHYHLGLEVAVYRMEGDTAGVEIYRNDEVVKVIPWAEEMSESVIADDDTLEWDDVNKVVRWGSDDDLESGLILDYDTDNHFYAKFVGNKQCLKSESKHFNYNLPMPTNFEAKITFDLDGHSTTYNLTETTSINATLTDIEDTPIVEETIKWYDGSTLLGTTTTNSDGATQSPNITGSALHNIRAVFDGNSNHYAVENTIQVSKGYIIDIEYDKLWSYGRGSVTGTVTDYFDNPIDDVEINCNLNNSATTLTGYTDEDGKVTLTNTDQTMPPIPPLQLVSEYGDQSEQFSPKVPYFTSYTITPRSDFVALGKSVVLTVNATASDYEGLEDVSLEGLEVNVSDCTPSTVTLNSDGNAKTYYTGTSMGDKTITATFDEEITATTTIHDLIQYGNVNSSDSNIKVSTQYGSFTKVTNGYKIITSYPYGEDYQNHGMGQILIVDGSVTPETNFICEFDLVYLASDTDYHIVRVGLHNSITDEIIQKPLYCSAGVRIRLEKTNNLVKVYCDGELRDTLTFKGDEICINYLGVTRSSNIIFNNFKWWLI